MAVVLNLPAISPEDVWGAQNNANLAALRDGVNAGLDPGGALSNVPNVDATQRANHVGTQVAATISDFQAAVYAAVVACLAAGANLAVTSSAGVITISGTTQAGDIHAFFNGSVYPSRASITTNAGQTVIWQGPDNNKVQFGAGFAIDGVDQFEGY